MNFLVDAQLPPAMARWLSSKGYEAIHVSEVGMHDAKDDAIWDLATARHAVIITKDEEFANKRILATEGPVVVRVRLGNSRNSVLMTWLERGFPAMVEAIERGETQIELA